MCLHPSDIGQSSSLYVQPLSRPTRVPNVHAQSTAIRNVGQRCARLGRGTSGSDVCCAEYTTVATHMT